MGRPGTKRTQRLALGALLLAALAAGPALGAPLDASQRACVVELNRRGADLAGAQSGEALRCLAQAARGREPDAQGCLSADGRRKVARARARLAAGAAKRCRDPLPPFAYTDPTDVADHAALEAKALTADLFGGDLSAAVASRDGDPGGAACQAAVAAGAEHLARTLFRLAGKAKGAALAGDRTHPPAEGADALAQAIVDALASDPGSPLARAEEKLRKRAAKKCAATATGALFPGACTQAASAEALAACAGAQARCRFCRSLALFDALYLDCDAFDDALSNASCESPVLPALASSTPAPGAQDVVPSRWLVLEFGADFPADRAGEIALRCDGADRAVRAEASGGPLVFVIPAEALPPGTSCELHWPARDGLLAFSTGAASPVALYDRTDALLIAPFPDDALLVDDPSTGSGKRIALEPPPFEGLLGLVGQGIATALGRRDGFSPLQPFALAFSDALDPATVPLGAAASLEPDASVALLDVDRASPRFGERIPFTTAVRNDAAPGGATDHSLVLWPALDLEAGGRYALVVTRSAHTVGGQPFGPSGFFERVLLGAPDDPADVQHARAALAPVLDALDEVSPPIAESEVALAVSISIRSEAFDPSDWVSVKEQILAAPPPVLDVTETESSAEETVYRGTVALPLWITTPSLTEVTRDAGTGAPTSLGTEDVPFVFRVPANAPTPMPVVIYQHGSPGSPEEIAGANSDFLIEAGYAMLGIQDVSNRRFGQSIPNQTTQTIGRLAFVGALPLTEFQTDADMLALLRAIQGMGVAGNYPEIDPTRILFRGISFGSHHSLGFLPFAPEVTAAASHVGSGRLYQPNLHQLDYNHLLDDILLALPGARPRDVIAGLAALQNEQDRDDPALLARYLYREPLAIAGLADTTPPSLLWIEGIGDSLVPNVATEASAVSLGIPTVRPVASPSPVLTEVDAPLQENIAPGVTAGHFQYDPAQTPSCVTAGQTEGHFCAQIALELDQQVLHFYATALAGAPEIADFLP